MVDPPAPLPGQLEGKVCDPLDAPAREDARDDGQAAGLVGLDCFPACTNSPSTFSRITTKSMARRSQGARDAGPRPDGPVVDVLA
jgi:hypothetical protein